MGEMTVWENAVLERLRSPAFSTRGFVRQAARAYAAELIDRFDVRGATSETRIRLLSGGNMQKLILGRVPVDGPRNSSWPISRPAGSTKAPLPAVHAELLAARAEGAAILLISEELEEAVALSDRIQAIVKGRLSQPVPADEADARRLGPDDGRRVGGNEMRLERRERVPLALVAGAPLAAIFAALALAAGLIAAAGVNPLTAYAEMLRGALGSRLAVTEMLTRATPLILTGLAAAVAFRARLWNIGGEGQFYLGALVTAWIGHSLGMPGP